MVMIATRFFDLIVGNNRLESIDGSINHNSMIMTMILEFINRPGRLSLATLFKTEDEVEKDMKIKR